MEDVDLDLDELFDVPGKRPTRSARFAPKGSKLKPTPKTESFQTAQSSLDSNEITSKQLGSLPKMEELASKPDFGNDMVEMDVDIKSGEIAESGIKKEENNDFMETEVVGAGDEVVREIDVYYSPSLDPNTKLYVLQYPLRPSWRPYDLDEKCEEVRVKPASGEVEVDMAIDADSKNYDRGADPRLLIQKQTLTSSWKPHQTSGYAVGVLIGNKLHMNPIHAVAQLRPSMKHLDKRKNATSVENTVKAEETEGKPSVTSNNLDWIPLKYNNARSDMATEYLRRMVVQASSPICFTLNSFDYLNSLCPGASDDCSKSKGPSRRFLMALSLNERIKTWLVEGPPIHRFDTLKHLAADDSVDDVLEALQEHARLVQGLWVPKSSLVYGIDQGLEVLARDRVLLLFRKTVFINNSELSQNPKLAKAMRDVLKVLAVERPMCSDWKLKELPDFNFMKQNSSVVKKQEEEWARLENKINSLPYGRKNGPGMKESSTANATNNLTSKSSHKLGTRNLPGATSKTQISEEAREAIFKALQKLFKSVKICSFQRISQLLRDMAVSESARSTGFAKEAVTAANSIDAFPTELQTIISQLAVNIHGVCVPKSSPDYPQYDAFRKVVINLFIAEGPNAKLKKAPIIEAAKLELKREISPVEYQKVLQELCVPKGSAWVLRSSDGIPN